MTEMKTVSFWKSLEIVLTNARLPDAQLTNPWPIVKLEGVANMPSRLPQRSAPADRSSENAGTSARPSAQSSAVRPAPRRLSHDLAPNSS